MMKKIMAVVLYLVCVCVLGGCETNNTENDNKETTINNQIDDSNISTEDNGINTGNSDLMKELTDKNSLDGILESHSSVYVQTKITEDGEISNESFYEDATTVAFISPDGWFCDLWRDGEVYGYESDEEGEKLYYVTLYLGEDSNTLIDMVRQGTWFYNDEERVISEEDTDDGGKVYHVSEKTDMEIVDSVLSVDANGYLTSTFSEYKTLEGETYSTIESDICYDFDFNEIPGVKEVYDNTHGTGRTLTVIDANDSSKVYSIECPKNVCVKTVFGDEYDTKLYTDKACENIYISEGEEYPENLLLYVK